jgi:small-conductance mechanosensitive channel
MNSKKQRSTLNELLIILIKFIVYSVLFYFNLNKPPLYSSVSIIGELAGAVLVFIGASLSVSVIRFIIIYWYISKNKLKSSVRDNFILGINRIVSVLNTVFFIIAFMVFMGIDPVKFLTSITIVAAAIALTFKDYITNMINGLIIMFSDRLSLGDHIKVQDQEGKILDITLLNVIIQNEDNDMVLVPNSVILTSIVVNQSKQNIKKLTVEFELDLKHGYTPETLEKYLWDSVKAYEENINKEGLSVKTMDVKKDTARFKIQVLLKYHDKIKEREIRRCLNSKVLDISKVKE